MLVVQILCLVGLACAISIFFYSKLLRMLIIVLFSLFIMLQIISIYLTGELIGYQFLVNLHLEDIQGYLFQLSKELVLAVVMFAILFWVLLRLTELLLFRLRGLSRTGGTLIMTSLMLPIGLPADGVVRSFFDAYKIIAPTDIEFEAALASVGIDPESYVLPNNVEATSGKNIIVISLESLEKGFLFRFPEWTPNLNRLAKEWSITDLEIGPGGTWTAGALYKYQVGMPAFLPGIKGNRSFQKTTSASITGLGNVLKAADYHSYFIMDKVEFAGTADLLNAYGVKTINAESSFGHYVNTALGLELHDADVFFEAKEQIKAFEKSHRPFALFLSTTDSHMNGIRDPRMEELIPGASNKLQYSVQVLDYLVGDFVTFLDSEGLLSNTAIFIFPDHNTMLRNDQLATLFDHSDRLSALLDSDDRKGFLLTNTASKLPSVNKRLLTWQIDLPRIILSGAEIDTNAKFLTDAINREDIGNFLALNKENFAALNKSSLEKNHGIKDIFISQKGNKLTVLAGDDTYIAELDDLNSGKYFDLVFNREMVLMYDTVIADDALLKITRDDVRYRQIHLSVSIQGDKIFTYLGNRKDVGLYRSGRRVRYSESEVAAIVDANLMSKYLKTPSVTEYSDKNLVTAVSSARTGAKKYRSRITIPDRILKAPEGINLLLDDGNGSFSLHAFGTLGDKQQDSTFVATLEELREQREFWMAVLHHKVNIGDELALKLKILGLPKLSDLEDGTAYVAYVDRTFGVHEITSDFKVRVIVPRFFNAISSEEFAAHEEERRARFETDNRYREDVTRFIAHGGGQIEGYNYTNSLEALDASYDKGFRLLELDLIKTSDDFLVAAHDWEYWASITGHTGPLPPTKSEFMSKKPHDQFTPIDLEAINIWFEQHSDATLVTDKTNEPSKVLESFEFKDRLMMELFSWEAVDEAAKAGVSIVMPTGGLMSQVSERHVEFLQKRNITHMAVSLSSLKRKRPLFQSLADAGIRLYAYKVGNKEHFVACNERDLFYGMYADEWDFNSPLVCN